MCLEREFRQTLDLAQRHSHGPRHAQQSSRSSKVTCRNELLALQVGVWRELYTNIITAKTERPIPLYPYPSYLILPYLNTPPAPRQTKPINIWTLIHLEIFTNFSCERFPTHVQKFLGKKYHFLSLQGFPRSRFYHICSLLA